MPCIFLFICLVACCHALPSLAGTGLSSQEVVWLRDTGTASLVAHKIGPILDIHGKAKGVLISIWRDPYSLPTILKQKRMRFSYSLHQLSAIFIRILLYYPEKSTFQHLWPHHTPHDYLLFRSAAASHPNKFCANPCSIRSFYDELRLTHNDRVHQLGSHLPRSCSTFTFT